MGLFNSKVSSCRLFIKKENLGINIVYHTTYLPEARIVSFSSQMALEGYIGSSFRLKESRVQIKH
jgi:hypothetical protein